MTLFGIIEGVESRVRTRQDMEAFASQGSFKGKRVVITGGNRGLGRAAAVQLAALGAHVVVACRHKDVAQGIVEEARSSVWRDEALEEPQVSAVFLDLSDMDSVVRCAKELSAMPRIDVLITNAAVVPAHNSTTRDGFEQMFQVNYLAHALLLLHVLGPDLQSAEPPLAAHVPQVVMVASEAHRLSRPLFQHPLGEVVPYDHSTSMAEYAYTKLALVTFAQELQRRLPCTVVRTLCPGPVNTDIARHSPAFLRPFVAVVMSMFATPSDASQAVIARAAPVPSHQLCAARDAAPHWHMAFSTRLRPDAYDDAAGQRLWTDTQELLHNWL